MKRKHILKIIVIAVLCSTGTALNVPVVCAQPRDKEERHDRSHRPDHHHPYYGWKVSLPELIATAILVGGIEYYYHQGLFYKKTRSGYVIVDAPVGAHVNVLPLGAKKVVINGDRYYYYNGVYFVKRPLGYYVVEDPVYEVVALPKEIVFVENSVSKMIPAETTEVKTAAEQEEFVVNILNQNGSYTPVKIVRSGDGFLGPQGEYYTEFPTVEQLKVMYAK